MGRHEVSVQRSDERTVARQLRDASLRISEGHEADCNVYEDGVCGCGYDAAVLGVAEPAADAADLVAFLETLADGANLEVNGVPWREMYARVQRLRDAE